MSETNDQLKAENNRLRVILHSTSAMLKDIEALLVVVEPPKPPEPESDEAMMSAVLCYVDDAFAFFTTQPLSQQWGDDWNDAPYECNAGTPYAFSPHDADNGKQPWKIYRVAFDGLEKVGAYTGNSHLSVEAINKGAAPWLKTWDAEICIPAGTTLADFIKLVHKAGGNVYMPVKKEL